MLTEKGKFQELNDFIEENITAAESKRLLITLRGVTKDASTHPPIFEASVDPNEPLLAQLHLSVDQTAISAEMGTSQVFHQGKLITDADTCAGL